MKKTYGHKYFVIAMLQMGITLVSRGSAENAASSFVASVPNAVSDIAQATELPECRGVAYLLR